MSTNSQRLATNRPVDGVLTTRDGRPAVRFERQLAHPVDKIWKAISEPSELAHWFPAEVEVDLRLGGEIRYFFANEGPGGDGEITEFDPPNLLEFTWNGEVLRFELQPDGDACQLTFIHTFDDAKGAPKFAAGWHGCLGQLDSLLADEPIEGSLDPWDSVYDKYVEKFGGAGSSPQMDTPAADGVLEESDGTYTLRFERFFDRPIERVWMALTRPDELVKWMAEAEVDPTAGGRFNLRWLNTDDPAEQGSPTVMHGIITRLEWPNVLEVDSDIHGLLRWELRQAESGCLLTFSTTLSAPNDSMSELLAGWHIHLDHLASALHGHPVDWSQWAHDHWDEFVEHHDRYAAALA